MRISVVIITKNEEENLPRTLRSVQPLVAHGRGEIIVVDSGSTDRTCEIAREFGADVYVEEWKGFAAQKNSAIKKAKGVWVLSLDADEEVSPALAESLEDWINGDFDPPQQHIASAKQGRPLSGVWFGLRIPRRNYFLGRWIRHGGFFPDQKLRFFLNGMACFDERPVHETIKLTGPSLSARRQNCLIHHAYPTLHGYIEHMDRYSSLGAEIAVSKGQVSRSIFAFLFHTLLRPKFTFLYNYVFRLGFLDGREGLLLHLYHSVYVSWKYAKAWEAGRRVDSR